MAKVTADYTNPKRKKPVTDRGGHYDIDGVTQAPDFEVIVAGDRTYPNKPVKPFTLKSVKLKFKNWISAWHDTTRT